MIDMRVSPRLSRLPDVWLQLVKFHGYEFMCGGRTLPCSAFERSPVAASAAGGIPRKRLDEINVLVGEGFEVVDASLDAVSEGFTVLHELDAQQVAVDALAVVVVLRPQF